MRIAIIPARGGSKRIPRKNVREFRGKPMIAWTIELAKESRLFDRIIVSTDDPEISDIAVRWGAEVPFIRPTHLADDFIGTTEVVAHAAEWALAEGWPVSEVCCLYATAPLMQLADVHRGLAVLQSGMWDYVFAATNFPAPIFRSFKLQPDGGVEMFFPDAFSSRSQDLPEALHDAAQFYWGRTNAWIGRRRLFDANSTIVHIPRARVQDIDDEDDWVRAEMIHQQIQGQRDGR